MKQPHRRIVRTGNLVDETVERIGVVDEVGFERVHDQCRYIGVSEKMSAVCLGQVLEVADRDMLFHGATPLSDVADQTVEAALQIDDQIRLLHPLAQCGEHRVVERILVFVERQGGKNAILVERIIADDHLMKEVELGELLDLSVAAEKEKHLRLEGISLRIDVEILQEWILLKSLEHEPCFQPIGKNGRKRRLACADYSFNSDKSRNISRVSVHSRIRSVNGCAASYAENADGA